MLCLSTRFTALMVAAHPAVNCWDGEFQSFVEEFFMPAFMFRFWFFRAFLKKGTMRPAY